MKKKLCSLGMAFMSATLLAACNGGTAPASDSNDDSPEYLEGEEEGDEDTGFLGNPITVSGSITPLVSGDVVPWDTSAGEKDENVAEELDNLAADYNKGEELWAMVSSAEEAEEIAALYGIELVSFAQGVATYHTDEDPASVVKRGRENGLPAIAINRSDTVVE